MRRGFWVLLLGVLAGFAPARHAYHSSLTELRYNAGKQQVELSIKLFSDDLEKVLSQGQPTRLDLAALPARALPLAAAYLARTVELKTLAGAPLKVQLLGMQRENDAYWLYAKASVATPLTGLRLRQAVLLDVFADQANIVNVEAGGGTQSALLRNGHEWEVMKW